MRKNDVVHAIQPPHEHRAVIHGVDEPDLLTEYERIRMAVEAHRGRTQAKRRRLLPRPAQQRTVAGMDAVEKSKRDYTRLFHVHSTSKKLFTVVSV